MNTRGFDVTALTLVVIGAINWGLIGFFDFNLIHAIFGTILWLERVIYALVGIAGIYSLSIFGRVDSKVEKFD